MSSHTNFIPKNQATINYKQTKLLNQDENYIKISQANKTISVDENLSHREFGKIIPYTLNENVNQNINAQKVLENKENVPKNIIIDHKNTFFPKTRFSTRDDPTNKLKMNTYRNRANTKSVNEVKREALLQTMKTINSSIINDEPKPSINSIQSFVVNTHKPNNTSTNMNNSQLSNFSNLNITNQNHTQNTSSFYNTSQGNIVSNLENNKFQNQDSHADEKMMIDDSNFPVQPVITVQQHIPQNQNTIVIKKENFQVSHSQNQSNNGLDNYSKISQFVNYGENNSIVISLQEIFKTGSQQIFNPQPQLVDDYIDEIFSHLKEIEFNITTNPLYMRNQNDINEKMRAILIDWLVEVHLKFKLVPETLFLTVNLIDRYLDKKIIMRNRLQLVGVTAMLIACKYEEIYAPEVRDFVYITDKAYTKEEIFLMENDILSVLEYNITVPSSYRYMEVFNRFLRLEENAIMFCRYLLELFLVEYKMIKYNPSLLAAATMYITLKITKKLEAERVTDLTGYSDETLKDCAKDICHILDNVEKSSLQAIRKKFSLPKFMEVAKIKFN